MRPATKWHFYQQEANQKGELKVNLLKVLYLSPSSPVWPDGKIIWPLTTLKNGSRCGWVGRAVASNTSGPLFKSSHQQNLYLKFTVNCFEKTKIKKKEACDGALKNTEKLPQN